MGENGPVEGREQGRSELAVGNSELGSKGGERQRGMARLAQVASGTRGAWRGMTS